MGDMRKDYVSERFHDCFKKKMVKKLILKKILLLLEMKSMTNPSVLSLVEKDGMLQRLQDSEDDYVEGWSIRVF